MIARSHRSEEGAERRPLRFPEDICRSVESRFSRGFTLLEILVVVAILGLLAAIAISNLLAAVDRSRQKRTMENMRTLSIAWEARASDLDHYNAAGVYAFPPASVSPAELRALLSPTYVRNVPTEDGWDRAMDFGMDVPVGSEPASHYAIRSSAGDALFQSTLEPGMTTSFDCDIVYADGAFIAYPDGIQIK